jgi:hypothetical protein
MKRKDYSLKKATNVLILVFLKTLIMLTLS